MTKRLIRRPRRNVLSIRSIVVLFLATLTASLIILSVLFNVVFKNIDMSFNTRIPESAPIPESTQEEEFPANEQTEPHSKEPFEARFRQEGIYAASLNVPGASTVVVTPRADNELSPPIPELPALTTLEGIPVPTPAPRASLVTVSPSPKIEVDDSQASQTPEQPVNPVPL